MQCHVRPDERYSLCFSVFPDTRPFDPESAQVLKVLTAYMLGPAL
jgi:hypothetical protein